MDGTIIGQGTFTAPSTIVNQVVAIPSGADWMQVTNYTNFGTVGGAAAAGIRYYWQRGMPTGAALVEYYTNASAVINGDQILSGGFTFYDPSGNTPGALPLLGNPVATSASTNATMPVISTIKTDGISVGTIVRMSNTAQTDVNGIDMVVGAVTTNTSFTLLTDSNPLATVPGASAGAGFYRIVNYLPLFYPRRRYVVNVTAAGQVSTSVPHGYTVGQQLRFNIPAVSGMTQLNPTPGNNYQSAIVETIVDAYNFTININTSSFTAFTWPTIAQQPSSFPEVTPFGEDTATALAQTPPLSSLEDATVNTGFLGMLLGTGGTGVISTAAITGPAGTTAGDIVYWVAGKSTYGGS